MISIRLSEDEYVALRQLCSTMQARSVSDLARDLLAGKSWEGSPSEVLYEVRSKLNSLDAKIEQLSSKLADNGTDSVE